MRKNSSSFDAAGMSVTASCGAEPEVISGRASIPVILSVPEVFTTGDVLGEEQSSKAIISVNPVETLNKFSVTLQLTCNWAKSHGYKMCASRFAVY